MTKCPVCARSGKGSNKTCGAKGCVIKLTAFSREAGDLQRAHESRRRLYGETNEWITWERKGLPEALDLLAKRYFA